MYSTGDETSLSTFLEQTDVLVVCLPAAKATMGMLDKARLARMKNDAILSMFMTLDIQYKRVLYLTTGSQSLKSTSGVEKSSTPKLSLMPYKLAESGEPLWTSRHPNLCPRTTGCGLWRTAS